MKRDRWLWLAVAPILVLLIGFELAPLLQLLVASFRLESGRWTLHNYAQIFTGKIWLAAMTNSLLLSVYSTVAGLVLSVLGAYALSRSTGRTRAFVTAAVSVCVNFSGVPLTFAFIIILGSSGVLAYMLKAYAGIDLYAHWTLYGPNGLLLVYLYFQIPLGIFLVLPAFAGLRPEWEEAAANLGARPWEFWRRVGLPVLAPSLAATASILFANALGAQATAYALTNGMMNLMTVRLGRLVSGDIDADPNLASAGALVLALLMVAALLINRRLTRRYQAALGKEGT